MLEKMCKNQVSNAYCKPVILMLSLTKLYQQNPCEKYMLLASQATFENNM